MTPAENEVVRVTKAVTSLFDEYPVPPGTECVVVVAGDPSGAIIADVTINGNHDQVSLAPGQYETIDEGHDR